MRSIDAHLAFAPGSFNDPLLGQYTRRWRSGGRTDDTTDRLAIKGCVLTRVGLAIQAMVILLNVQNSANPCSKLKQAYGLQNERSGFRWPHSVSNPIELRAPLFEIVFVALVNRQIDQQQKQFLLAES